VWRVRVHAGSPLMAQWHGASAAQFGMPDVYDIDDVVAAFEATAFDAAAARLAIGFMPAAPPPRPRGGAT